MEPTPDQNENNGNNFANQPPTPPQENNSNPDAEQNQFNQPVVDNSQVQSDQFNQPPVADNPMPTPTPSQTFAPTSAKKSPITKILIILVSLLLVAGIATAVWIFVIEPNSNNSAVTKEAEEEPVVESALFDYIDDNYSIKIPKSLVKSESSFDDESNKVKFETEGAVSEDDTSSIDIDYIQYDEAINREEYIKQLDEMFSDGSSIFEESETTKNVIFTASSRDNYEIRTVATDIYKDEIMAGKMYLSYIMTNEGIFMISIVGVIDHNDVVDNMDQIVDSFQEI